MLTLGRLIRDDLFNIAGEAFYWFQIYAKGTNVNNSDIHYIIHQCSKHMTRVEPERLDDCVFT